MNNPSNPYISNKYLRGAHTARNVDDIPGQVKFNVRVVSRTDYRDSEITNAAASAIYNSRPIELTSTFDTFIIDYLLPRTANSTDSPVKYNVFDSSVNLISPFMGEVSLVDFITSFHRLSRNTTYFRVVTLTESGEVINQIIFRNSNNLSLDPIFKVVGTYFDVDKRVVATLCNQFNLSPSELRPYLLSLIPTI